MHDPSKTAEIVGEYRARLAEIDLDLVGLFVARRRLVRELLELKADRHLPLFDPAQEERVVARARQRAVELGAPPEEAERLMRWVLGEGRRSPPIAAPLR